MSAMYCPVKIFNVDGDAHIMWLDTSILDETLLVVWRPLQVHHQNNGYTYGWLGSP